MFRPALWAIAALAAATNVLAQVRTGGSYVLAPTWDINAPAQIRRYTLTITNVTGGPDGVQRPVLAINGQIPGPLIEANAQDTLSITVVNQMTGTVSIHWHGLYQNGTNSEDGVSGITQCPISPGGQYTYNFPLNGQFGTFWYHSHARGLLADGVLGPLVIHSPADPLKRGTQYDDDQVVFLGDWFHDGSWIIDAALDTPAGYNGSAAAPPPETILINGQGTFDCRLPTAGTGCRQVAPAEISLRPNVRSRLRFITGTAHATLRTSVDGHPLNVIEADATGIQNWPTNRVTGGPGQRHSAVVTTTAADAGKSFWLRAAMVTGCLAYQAPGDPTGRAIVRVLGTNGQVPTGTPTSTDFSDVSNGGRCVDPPYDSMKPLIPVNPPSNVAGRGYFRNQFLIPPALPLPDFVVNGISFRSHPWDPLLYKLMPGGSGNLGGTVANITESGPTWYDMVMVNLDPFDHPFHRHSNDMHIVAWGAGNPTDAQLNGLTYKVDNPLRRDTIAVAGSSFVVVRVHADSPGLWTWHCHIGAHLSGGKLAVIIDQPAAIARFQIPPANRALCNAAPPNGASIDEPARRRARRAMGGFDEVEIIQIRDVDFSQPADNPARRRAF